MSASKNILYILPVSERGGAERVVETWVQNHSAAFTPHVLVPREGPLATSMRRLGCRVVVPPHFRMRNFVKALKFLIQYIRTESIDLIHSTMPKAHLFGGLAAAATHKKEIWFHHGPLASNRYQGLIPLIPSKMVLVATEYMRSMQQPTFYNAPAIRIVPCGIDTLKLTPCSRNRTDVRKKLGIGSDTMVIGMFGRLISWKGQHVVLQALRRLRQENRKCKFHCIFVGGTLFDMEPEYQIQLKNLTTTLGIEDAVSFSGHIENVYPYYDLSDVVVHASLVPEPFGMVVSEAMAKEKIVIATQGGGPSELIKSGVNGFLYKPGDEADLSNILADLGEIGKAGFDNSYCNQIGQNARNTIVSGYSIKKSIEKLEGVYHEVLG